MSDINTYFFETATNNTHEAVFLANYVLLKEKIHEIDNHISTLNNKEIKAFEPKCVSKMIDNLRSIEMFGSDMFPNGTWWSSISFENEEELTKDLIECFNLHEQHEDDKEQQHQIFIRKLMLSLLQKYPNHTQTYSSCSLNKKVLGIRDKIANL